jgi:peptidoglycan biosynthesis protein MviN/MurJ (putative lipid II flippase)
LVILAFGVPAWVLQQVAVRGFYARGEMWRAMFLNTIVACSVFPLYLWGSQVAGISGLAMASVAAISLNALITIVWLRLRGGTPRLAGLAETFGRTALITLAASATSLAAMRALAAGSGLPVSALTDFLVGATAYLLVGLLATFVIGDAALRATLGRLLARRRD